MNKHRLIPFGWILSLRHFVMTFGLVSAIVGAGGMARADTHYVNKANPTPTPGFTNGWASAATNINDAVDWSSNGDTVLVWPGVYNTGGRTNVAGYDGVRQLTNRVCIRKAISLVGVSANPVDTLIVGAPDPATGTNGPGAIRCLFILPGASISGFTLTNGFTGTSGMDASGGGAFCSDRYYVENNNVIFSNCVIAGCRAASQGAGVVGGTLYSCMLRGNYSLSYGSATTGSILKNCLVEDNDSDRGWNFCATFNSTLIGCTVRNNPNGFAYGGTLTNCTVSGTVHGNTGVVLYNSLFVNNTNSGFTGRAINCTFVGNNVWGCGSVTNCVIWSNTSASVAIAAYSCVQGSLLPGPGNITNHPLFVDYGAGNYRLMNNSPCVNTGTNQDWMTNTVDLTGVRRIIDGTVDMGAYEFLPRGTIITILGAP